MSVRPEDEQRIAAYFAGELDEQQCAELQARLREDAELRLRFARVASDELALGEALGRDMPRFAPPRELSPRQFSLRPWSRLAAAAALLAAIGAAGWWLWRSMPRNGAKGSSELAFIEVRSGERIDERALREGRVFEAPAGLVLDLRGTRVTAQTRAQLVAAPPLPDPRDPRDRDRNQLAVLSGAVDIENAAGSPGLRLLTPAGVLRDLGTRFTVRVDALGGTADMSSFASLISRSGALSSRFASLGLVTAAVLAGAVGFESSAPHGALAQEQVLKPEMGPVALSADNSIAKIVDREGLAHRRDLGSERWRRIDDEARFLPGTWLSTGSRGAHALRVKLASGAVITLGPGAQLELIDAASVRLHSGEARVQSADEQHPTRVAGPGSSADVEVRGTRHLRAADRALTALDRAPQWLEGYDQGRPTEALGALVARIDGRDVPLSIGYHKVQVDVRDQVARTTIEQSFVNHTTDTLEGVFYFPLPEEASVSSFALWVGNQWIEGEVVEKERARAIYETLLREKRDPGLLEWSGGNLFKARIYPIHAEKRVKIVYTQVLPRTGDGFRYRYPLKSELTALHPLKRLELDFTVASSEEIAAVESPTHSCRIQASAHAARVEHSSEEVVPKSDFEVLVRTKPAAARFLPHRRGEDGYFVLLFDAPQAEGNAEATPGEWIFVCDTSGSMASARSTQQDLLEALLKGLSPQDRFQVAAFDVDTAWAFDGYRGATDATREQAMNFLAARTPLGWTRFEAAFEQVFSRANEKTRIVYLGDGIPSGGERHPGNLMLALERLRAGRGEVHAIGIGAQRERLVLEGLARFGGTVRTAGSDADPGRIAEQALREIASPGITDLEVRFDGLATAAVHPSRIPRLPAGEQAVIVGRFDPATAAPKVQIAVRARRGAETLERAIEVDASRIDASNDFAPRLWARRRLDHLLEQGASAEVRAHIIALSEDFQILTPYTSFLVLETAADRERFDVEKRMRIRDGEIFFAAARESAQAELHAQALRASKSWRQGLRAEFLRSIREMGREHMAELRLEDLDLAVANAPARRSLRSAGRGGAPGSRSDSGRLGDLGESKSELFFDQRGLESESGEEGERSEYGLDGKKSPAGEYVSDYDVEVDKVELSARNDESDDGTVLKWKVRGRGDEGYFGRAPSTPGPRLQEKLGLIGPSGDAPQVVMSLFPRPGRAVERAELPAAWPEEVRALVRALDARSALLVSEQGVRCAATSERIDARGAAQERRSSELVIAPGGWWWSGHAAAGESANAEWVANERRAALDPRWSLGTWRKAVPSDLGDWPASLPHLQALPAHDLSRFRASLTRTAEGTRLLVLTDARSVLAGRTFRYELEIDAEREYLRALSTFVFERLTERRIFTEPQQVAGLWWPARCEVLDGELRAVERWTFDLRELARAEADREIAGRSAVPSDAIVLGALPPDPLRALDAARAEKASVEELVLLIETYGGARRWDVARPHAERLLAATREKRGSKRLALALQLAERRLEAARATLVEIARELAAAGRPADAAAAEDLAYTAHFAAVGERREIASILEAVHARQPEIEARLRVEESRIELLSELGHLDEATAIRERLSRELPESLRVQIPWVQWLAQRDRVAEALAHLALVRGRTPWRFSERAQILSVELDLLVQSRRFEEFVERFTALDASASAELPEWSFERYPTILTQLDRADRADRVVFEWLEAGAGESANAIALLRLDAAISHAIGRAWGLWRSRFDETFERPLAELVRRTAEREEHAARVERILSTQGFRNTAAGEAWLRAMSARLDAGATALPLATAVRFARWARFYREFADEGEALERRILGELLSRYESQDLRDENDLLADLVTRMGQPEERQRYWQRRLARSESEAETARAREQLFEALLAGTWSEAIESRLLTLLPSMRAAVADLQPELRALADRLARARSLWRITTTGEMRRIDRAIAALPERDRLDRRALKAARESAALAARAAVAARLRELDPSQLPADLGAWLACESIYFETRAGAPRPPQWERTLALLEALPKPGPDEPEADAVALAERLLATAAWFACLGGSEAGDALPRCLTWLRAQPRGERALFEPRVWESGVLIGTDRGAELAERLTLWFGNGQASVEAPWGVLLAQIQAETDALAAAVETLQRVEAQTPLARRELELAATWRRALGDETAYRAARDRGWAAASESELDAWLDQQLRRVSRRAGAMPQSLDPETPRALAALLAKAEHPANYAWTLRSLYRATRDPRLFEGLAAGVLGASAASACDVLANLHDLFRDDLQEESAVDVAAEAVERVRAAQPSSVDRRAVDLLELVLRVRALELRQQDRTHLDAALAAFDGVARATWSEGEALACARWLARLGKVGAEALRERVRRQFAALENALPAGSADRAAAALARADWLWTNEAFDAALEAQEAALASLAALHGGRLPDEQRGTLESFCKRLSQRARWIDAERRWQAELATARTPEAKTSSDRERWAERELHSFYVDALRANAATSLGRGAALWKAFEALSTAALARADAPEHVTQLVRIRASAWKPQADGGHREDVLAAMMAFARGDLSELLARHRYEQGQQWVAIVAASIHEVGGPALAVRFFVERAENEPRRLSRGEDDFWAQHAWRFSKAIVESGRLEADVEARAIAVVLAALREDLRSQQAHGRYVYARHSNFWSTPLARYVEVAREVMAERGDREGVAIHVGNYLLEDLQDAREAAELLLVAERKGVLRFGGRLLLARALRRAERNAEAAERYEQLAIERPDVLEVHTELLRSLFGAGRREALPAAWTRAVAYYRADEKRMDVSVRLALGWAALDSQLLEEAVAMLREGIDVHTRSSPSRGIGDGVLGVAYQHLAEALSRLGRAREAIDAAAGAIVAWSARQGERAEANKNLRDVIRRTEDLGAIRADLDAEAARTGQENPLLRFALGEVLLERKAYAEAVLELVLAAELTPENLEVQRAAITALDAAKRGAEAEARLLELARTTPHERALWTELAARFAARGAALEAERARTSVVEAEPLEPDAHAALAAERERLEDFAAALTAWSAVEELASRSPKGALGRARALLALGRVEEARAVLSALRAKRFDPEFADELKELPQLEGRLPR